MKELFDKDLDAIFFINHNRFWFNLPDNFGNSLVSVIRTSWQQLQLLSPSHLLLLAPHQEHHEPCSSNCNTCVVCVNQLEVSMNEARELRDYSSFVFSSTWHIAISSSFPLQDLSFCPSASAAHTAPPPSSFLGLGLGLHPRTQLAESTI
ncbi:hypothetical protein EV2_009267 [Malus domestica]